MMEKMDDVDIFFAVLITAVISGVIGFFVGLAQPSYNATDCRPDSDEKVGHVYYSGECHIHPKNKIAL